MEYRSPRTEAELEDSFACSYSALGGDASFFGKIVRLDPWFRMEHTRACFVDGRVVSVVQLFERQVRIGSCVVKAGSIGSVGTHPDYRGRGYGVGVLHDTARFLRREGFDLSFFFTAIRQHYAKGGWVIHPTSSLEVTLPDVFPDVAAGIEVERFRVERDHAGVEAVFDQENATRTGTIVRTPKYWEARGQWSAARDEEVWVGLREGKVVAYVCEEDGNVREMGRLSGEDAALASVLSHVWSPLKRVDVERVRVRAPVGGRALLASLGCGTRSRESPSLMIRLVNLESLMRKIEPLLNERAEAAGIDGNVGVRFVTEADACAIRVQDGGAEVIGDDGSQTELRLSQSQMLGLIAGRMTIGQVVEANGLEVEAKAVAILDPLFPSDPFHHWTWDRRMHAE